MRPKLQFPEAFLFGTLGLASNVQKPAKYGHKPVSSAPSLFLEDCPLQMRCRLRASCARVSVRLAYAQLLYHISSSVRLRMPRHAASYREVERWNPGKVGQAEELNHQQRFPNPVRSSDMSRKSLLIQTRNDVVLFSDHDA